MQGIVFSVRSEQLKTSGRFPLNPKNHENMKVLMPRNMDYTTP